MTPAVVDIQNLRTYFHTDEGVVRAVDDVSLSIREGMTLGVVGESGSGKSVTSLSIMRLLAPTARIESGSISFLGRDLVGLPEPDMRRIRGKEISMIFQEPMSSLNPVFTVGAQVTEAIRLHQSVSKADARRRTLELFDEVGIPNPEQRIDSYPHQMSGGQKQRVMIAMALSCNPKLLIADEPTTALDVTIQAQTLDILRELRDRRGMAILFITHDLGVIAEIADEVAVMYDGKIVEYGSILDIFTAGRHPYTRGLLACRPRLDSQLKRLPTVDDFMETRQRDGEIEIVEKKLDDARLDELRSTGRGRLLHPPSELAAMGHPWEQGHHGRDTTTVAEQTSPLLEVENLEVHFPVRKGVLARTVDHVKAVDGISFRVYPGQTLGLVGESGCGKTTTGRAILRLVEPTAGKITFDGQGMESFHPVLVCTRCGRRVRGESVRRGLFFRWRCLSCFVRGTPPWHIHRLLIDRSDKLREIRRRMQIIFQDPYGSLNPRMTVESTLTEPMIIHDIGRSKADRRDRAAALLEEVGMETVHLQRYPHEFSGGQRQRICIARAIAIEPELLICDESVSALDVSVQAQVLNLLKDLQERRGLTYIFISHDLSVVKFMADMMAVMNQGKIVEFGPSENIYAEPEQQYTKRLIDATPRDDVEHIRRRQARRQEQLSAREKI